MRESIRIIRVSFHLIAIVSLVTSFSMGKPLQSRREAAARIVAQIQRADYEGDRTALERLYNELAALVDDKEIGARVSYWRGFAMWRKAINGFNDSASPGEMEQSLKRAVEDFEAAMTKDPGFIDAKAARGSSMGLLMFLYSRNPELAPEYKEPARLREYVLKAIAFLSEAEAAEPENPRVLWMLGPIRWNTPPERGGGQGKAIEVYEKGLKAARARKAAARDPLMPSWGEPELLMSLAWSSLNRSKPDFAAAEEYARSALALVPYWHYVKDILLPQIEAAKSKRS
ncbi:MAG: hypothetical protein AB1631_23020 [Acidobacteriota bacterium]